MNLTLISFYHYFLALLFGLFVPSLLYGQPAVFTSNAPFQLGLHQKYDLKIAGSYLKSVKNLDFDFPPRQSYQAGAQIAFSPFDKIGLASTFFKQHGTISLFEGPFWENQLLEFELGFYHEFGNPEPHGLALRTHVYIGRGWGKSDILFRNAGESHFDYIRNFAHTGLELWLSDHIALGLDIRYVNLNFSRSVLFGAVPLEHQNRIMAFSELQQNNFFESSFILQVGIPLAKLFFSINTINNPYIHHYALSTRTFKIGLSLQVHRLYRSKKDN